MLLSLGVRTTNGVDASAAWEIRTGATPGRVKLVEFGLFLTAAIESNYALGFPAAIGVTPTDPVDFLQEDTDNVLASGVLQSALAWATPPTVPANFYRRVTLPATIGTGVIWTFPKGIVIPVSSSIVLWNAGTNSVVDAYAVLSL